MASPLLEAGAIDGAKGILINITGSSSLKLTEVNEASTIIQNAAHEDANIIFGAVQDEAMGDEVKITVIATGFRQQEGSLLSGTRRDRMLADATLPTIRQDVPVAPRVATRATTPYGEPIHSAPIEAAPIFAREIAAAEIAAPHISAREIAAPAISAAEIDAEPILAPLSYEGEEETPEFALHGDEDEAQFLSSDDHEDTQELVPVARSVFDDEFFTKPRHMAPAEPLDTRMSDTRMPSARGFDSPDSTRPLRLHYDESSRTSAPEIPTHDFGVAEPAMRVPVFTSAVRAEPAESDELDIPAFLRRAH